MSIFKPTPGQVMDRMDILFLKIDAADEADLPVAHYRKERDKCLQFVDRKLQELKLPTRKKVVALANELRAQNEAQWNAENKIREAFDQLDGSLSIKKFMQVTYWAILTHKGNENRSRLVGEIDAFFGIEAERKIYS